METGEDYCPYLNKCVEAKKEICYSQGYRGCLYYEAQETIARNKPQEKGLVKKLAKKLGNPDDINLQL